MATKYARAAGGAWATDATWSTTSGGIADTTAPTASDDAVIDTNSGAVTSITGSAISLTITNTAVKTTALTFSGPLTLSGAFSVTGNSATNRIICQSTTLGTARTITAATTSLTNVDFRDITGAGAATWTGTSVGNALGNTGITFTTPVTRYAVATGSVSSTSVWSATSGGASGASVPLCHDTIVLNAASGAITVTNDMPRLCADLTCTGFTGTFTSSANTEVYGSVTAGSGMTISGIGIITMMGRSSHTITSAGKTWTMRQGIWAGTYTLADAWTSSRSSSNAFELIAPGAFNDGGFSMTLTGSAAAILVYSGTVTMSGTTTIASTAALTPWTFPAGGTLNHTGTIVLSGATATDRTFAGGGKTYGTLTDQNTSTGKLTITGQNTFTTINKTATVACTLALPTSSGCTFTTFAVTGISGAVLTLTGDVTKAEGTVSCDYLAISSSDATGGATFYAGANSTDGGTNTGWIFGAPTGGRPFKGGTATVKESDIEGALVVL